MRRDHHARAAGALVAAAILTGAPVARADAPRAVNAQPITPPAAAAAPVSFADVVARVAPAVVSIDVEGRTEPQPTALPRPGAAPFPFGDFGRAFPPFGAPARPQPFRGAGSGFFISADGYVVTNNHVIARAEKITVRTADERTLTARLIGRDPATDLAVLKVEGGGFPFVDLEDRAKPRVGDWVVAVGNPFNLGGTATAGIVSALSRPNVSGSSYVDYLQIDAPINRGNSGGPTFDLAGRVVGVNSAIFSPSGGSVGIGFDIPAEVAARVARQLIAEGRVVRGFIGATVQDLTPDIAESLGLKPRSGALVADIVAGGPADQAGLRSGDIVTAAGGAPITGARALTRRVAAAEPGGRLALRVRRADRQLDLTLTPGERPDQQAAAAATSSQAEPGRLGLALAPARGGLRVEAVRPGSDAAAKGLRPGDVIEKIGGRAAVAPADVTAAVQAARDGGRRAVLLQVRRGGARLFLALTPPDARG